MFNPRNFVRTVGTRKNNLGVSILEILIVIVVISTLSAIYFYYEMKNRHIYLFQQYSAELLNLSKRAKILAMERSTNTGVCPREHGVYIYDKGPDRGAPICSGVQIGAVEIPQSERNFFRFTGSGFDFDPRGFAIHNGNGNACLYCSKLDTYYMICVSRFGGIRYRKGSGLCPSRCD